MDELFALLFSPFVLIPGLGAFVLTMLIRRVVETRWPLLKKQADENVMELTYLTESARWWNEVVLYLLPVVLAMLLMLVLPAEVLPEKLEHTAPKLLGGLVSGFFSTIIYKIVKRLIVQRAGVSPEEIDLGEDEK